MAILVRRSSLAGEMSSQEERYWMHILSGDPMLRDFVEKQSAHGVDPMGRLMRQPICPKCERACFHHQQGIQCHHCGYTGPKTHKLQSHLKEGWWK